MCQKISPTELKYDMETKMEGNPPVVINGLSRYRKLQLEHKRKPESQVTKFQQNMWKTLLCEIATLEDVQQTYGDQYSIYHIRNG